MAIVQSFSTIKARLSRLEAVIINSEQELLKRLGQRLISVSPDEGFHQVVSQLKCHEASD